MEYIKIQALKRIKKNLESKDKSLTLSGLDIKELPNELFNLTHLEELNLNVNLIENIPNNILKLENLRAIDLGNNQIKVFPNILFELNKLEKLFLDENQISIMPEYITTFPRLHFLNINNNPITNIPIEIFNKKYNILDDVNNYFEQIKEQGAKKIFEAKILLVGAGGSGKTSLANKLTNPNYKIPRIEGTTRGLNILKYKFQTNYINKRVSFLANVWDFGGQEIYHTTHQFFLTHRSLYVLVADNRKEDEDFDYWLSTINMLGGNSPIIIIINQKEGRKRYLNEEKILLHFPSVQKIIKADLAHKIEFKNVRESIEEELVKLEHIGKILPKKWIRVKNSLESDTRNQISIIEYLTICQEHGISNEKEALHISQYLHDLGIILHYQDDLILYNLIIINPKWGTHAVYQILESKIVEKQKGAFTQEQLNSIWIKSKYPRNHHHELLRLMMRFELCYELSTINDSFWSKFFKLNDLKKSYIAPQLLTEKSPSIKLTADNSIIFKYDYELMPKGILTRIIVKFHRYIKENLVWRFGTVLKRNQTTAIITEDRILKEIKINVSGPEKVEFLFYIREHIDSIHKQFQKLIYKELIPCNCSICIKNEFDSKIEYFEFEFIQRVAAKGKKIVLCKESIEEVSVKKLLAKYGANKYGRLTNQSQIFILHSKQDVYYKKKIDISLSLLKKQQKIETFDISKIPPGYEINELITKKLKLSKVILLLLSPDFFAEDDLDFYINKEVKPLIGNDTIHVVPLLLRPCSWKSSIFKSLKPIPSNEVPISRWENEDEAILNINDSIRDLLIF